MNPRNLKGSVVAAAVISLGTIGVVSYSAALEDSGHLGWAMALGVGALLALYAWGYTRS